MASSNINRILPSSFFLSRRICESITSLEILGMVVGNPAACIRAVARSIDAVSSVPSSCESSAASTMPHATPSPCNHTP